VWNTEHHLYPYQEDAVMKMLEANVLLAYDMGVGKTPTTIAAIEMLRENGEVKETGTVVVPASLKYQWAREIDKFSDQRAVVIDGSPGTRLRQYQTVASTNPGYMIMSYDNIVRDWKLHKGLGDGFIVLDEATAIKSFRTQRTQHLKTNMRRWAIRYALTGTPIENGKAEELFSILEFIEPKLLGNFWEDFEPKYIVRNKGGWIESYKNLDLLHKRIRKNTLRRSFRDPDVAKHLPKVIRPDAIRVELDRKTRSLVEYINEDILTDLDGMAEDIKASFRWDADGDVHTQSVYGPLMAKIGVLRMLLDTPEAAKQSGYNFDHKDGGSKYAFDLLGRLRDIKTTPKLDAVNQYLTDFWDTDERYKAVIFTSFVVAAKKIHWNWEDRAVLFTGSMNSKQRDAAKQKFVENPKCRLFVSTDAGGYGLDLPQANLLINYDQPWQAGLLAQRNARIRRASSEWGHVTVQDFVVANTIEERMIDLLQHKIAVSEAIIDGEGIDSDGRLDRTDLETLRRFLTDQNDWSREEYAS
jgi:SNF2 family DNA or RNA helicase